VGSVLVREKREEQSRVAAELAEERRLGSDAGELDVLRSIQRTQLLLDEQRRIEVFNPTLVDLRFGLQISISVAAIVIANVLLRTVLADLLPK
jgi:hypothetical protein